MERQSDRDGEREADRDGETDGQRRRETDRCTETGLRRDSKERQTDRQKLTD